MDNTNKTKEGKYGQFFTATDMCSDVLKIVDSIKPIGGNILEPSFGIGNFVDEISKSYDYESIDAVEVDKENYEKYKPGRNVNTFNSDFLEFEGDKKYDLIVGNPPYIEVCYSFYDKEHQERLKKKYKGCSSGRLNLVHAFMVESFKKVEDDGIIAYLLPSSILTSPVYKKIRKTINDDFEIEYLKEDFGFEGVAIKVCLLIIRKKQSTGKYLFLNNDNYFIMEDYANFEHTNTIANHGFKVSVGDIIWNDNTELLSDVETDKVLVYSSNIKRDGFEVVHGKRPQYITGFEVKHRNCVVFPRTVSKSIKFYYIESNDRYVFENHTIVVTNEDKSKLDRFYANLRSGIYDQLLNSFFNSSNLTKSELLSLPFEQ